MEIQNGSIVSVEGCSEVNYLQEECLSKVDKGGKILGEITFGTNPRKSATKLNAIQEILRDTIHFGFGLNTHLGGDIVSNVHWDAVLEFVHEEIEIL